MSAWVSIWTFANGDFAMDDALIVQAKRCLLDLIGVAAAGRRTQLSSIVYDHSQEVFAASDTASAGLWFDGRRVSPAGAALANGMTIDAIDAHDGDPLCKGHVGCGLFPGLIACIENGASISGKEFLRLIIAGYEIGARAGISLHASAADYHTSGAWIAPSVALMGSVSMGLKESQARHAIGIGEYHGPRSPMMRAIDYPTMVKDGSGWGAMAGVSAAYLAKKGFTGAPAATFGAGEIWSTLGHEWRIMSPYFKPYPVCRWAQPAIAAVLALKAKHDISLEIIERIEIATFHEATRLAVRAPSDTEQAQYSLPFPVAVALVHGDVLPDLIDGNALFDPLVLAVASRIEMCELDAANALFPKERIAQAVLYLRDGQVLRSKPLAARGDADRPLSAQEIRTKFLAYATPTIGIERARQLEACIDNLQNATDLDRFLQLLTQPASL